MPFAGPTLREAPLFLPLPAPPGESVSEGVAGGALAHDGSLRIVRGGALFAVDVRERRVRWSRHLGRAASTARSFGEDAELVSRPSLPTVVTGDRTWVTLGSFALVFGPEGDLVERLDVGLPDDSGFAPNLDLEGRVVLTTLDGAVLVKEPGGLRTVGSGLGYDLPPVAVFDDGSFAVAGYAGAGICRLRSDGAIAWHGDLQDADLPPTVSRAQHTAVASVNDGCSAFFDPEGRRTGTFPHVALFAEHPADGGWIGLGDGVLGRLSLDGTVRWVRPIDPKRPEDAPGPRPFPLVDARGVIHVPTSNGIAAFDADGELVGELALGGCPSGLFPVGPGRMAAVVDDRLVLLA